MAMRAHFDDIIRSSMSPGKLGYLKEAEKQMTPPSKNQPKVMMEPGKREQDYPHTRKYDYTRPKSGKKAAEDYLDELMRESDPQQRKMPRSEMPFRRKRIRRNIADEPYDLEFEPFDPETPAEKKAREASKKATKGLDKLKDMFE